MIGELDKLSVDAGGESLGLNHRCLLGKPSALSDPDELGRHGYQGDESYLSGWSDSIFGSKTTNELVNTASTQEATWAKWTQREGWPLVQHRRSLHVSDWSHSGGSLANIALAGDYFRLDAASGTTPLDATGHRLSMQYFGGPNPGLSLFGEWTNLGAAFAGPQADQIAGLCAVEWNLPVTHSVATRDYWHTGSGPQVVGLQLISAGSPGTQADKLPTLGMAIAGWTEQSFKQGLAIFGYTKQGLVVSPRGHWAPRYQGQKAGLFMSDWDWDFGEGPWNKFGIYIERGGNGPSGYSDIEISVPADSGTWPFTYRRGQTGGIVGDGRVMVISETGAVWAEEVAVPLLKPLRLNGPTGGTKIVATPSRIEFWINGFLRGYVSAMGFQSAG